ncbi:GNAT family N-acetyltransferase [Paenibacillus sp. 32O-W]|uniref:GNAT family N-acetyltransferase n=1 Tax=Paenibacillus sp. 32O-W TaxID=1695218 RepID=UPI0011A6EE50|nr:GNAT family N-acetyltransferase [Paenibacillus sp. 32O-W]
MQLVDLEPKLGEEEIRELLEACVQYDPELLDRAVEEYRSDPELSILGLEVEDEIVGLLGIRSRQDNTVLIRHLYVKPEVRGNGLGRAQLLELISLRNPDHIIAEVEEESVDFFRNVGFTIVSFKEEDGQEKFRCTYSVHEQAEDEG